MSKTQTMNTPMSKTASLVSLLVLTSALARAGSQEFDFKDPKGVNNVVFKLDAPLESINGTASGISGKVTFDPQNPAALKGRLVVATSSMTVPNAMMKDHMHGEQWLDVAKHPEIVFEVVSVKNAKTSGDTTTADVTGKFTLKGVTREITVPARLTYLKDKLKARSMNQEGDLLVIRANFKIKRADYGIQPSRNEDKVSDEIDLSLSVAGAAPRT